MATHAGSAPRVRPSVDRLDEGNVLSSGEQVLAFERIDVAPSGPRCALGSHTCPRLRLCECDGGMSAAGIAPSRLPYGHARIFRRTERPESVQ